MIIDDHCLYTNIYCGCQWTGINCWTSKIVLTKHENIVRDGNNDDENFDISGLRNTNGELNEPFNVEEIDKATMSLKK